MSIDFTRQGQIGVITINRPEKLNALTRDMYEEITARLKEIDADPQLRIGVVTGAGERAFSAGADLHAMHARTGGVAPPWEGTLPGRFDFGLPMTKPLIAAVNGYCLAGGLELAIFCDIRIASAGARFGCPEVKWNLLHGFGAQQLPKLIGTSAALYLVLTGDFIDAREALRIGLVHEVVFDGQSLSRAIAVAERICRNGPMAVRMSKDLVVHSFQRGVDDSLRLYREYNRLIHGSEDTQEGVRAFTEDREPHYRDG